MQGNVYYFGGMSRANDDIKYLHAEAANLLKENKEDDFIIAYLQQKGVEKYYAETILENVRNDRDDRKQFYQHLFGGLFVTLAGIVMTIIGFETTDGGHIYLICGGVIVYGVYNISRAFIIFWK